MISGSVGFDDWEWGVTLFTEDPLQFKKLVYEMRFDEVSARFAEFGPFIMGKRVLPAAAGDFAAGDSYFTFLLHKKHGILQGLDELLRPKAAVP